MQLDTEWANYVHDPRKDPGKHGLFAERLKKKIKWHIEMGVSSGMKLT